MTGTVNSKQELVAQELARLAVLDRAGCLDLWKTWFGCEVPRYLSAVFMRKALAHEVQCRLLGRMAAADVRALRSIASGKRSADRAAPVLSAGTHLVREWNGRTYQVEVTKYGYVMDGKAGVRLGGKHWVGRNPVWYSFAPAHQGDLDLPQNWQPADRPVASRPHQDRKHGALSGCRSG